MSIADPLGRAYAVHPSNLAPAAVQRLLGSGLDERIIVQRSRGIDVLRGRDDVVVTREHHRNTGRRMTNQSFKPGQFVLEFGAGLRVSIGKIDGRDQNSLNSRLDIAGLLILKIARQTRPGQHRGLISGEDSQPVPRALTFPHSFISRRSDGLYRKRSLLGLELLQADHVWSFLFQSGQKIIQPFVDVIYVERGNFHDASPAAIILFLSYAQNCPY